MKKIMSVFRSLILVFVFMIALTSCEVSIKTTIKNISFEDQTVIYDGKSHSLEVEGSLPNEVTVVYENNGQVNAGIYEITATFEDTSGKYNVPEPMSATLTIKKADITGISFNDQIFTHDGQSHSIFVEGQLPEGVHVSYSNNNQTNAGTYEVIATFEDTTGNYNVPEAMKAYMTIVEDIGSNITFNNQTYTYDGQSHSIFIQGQLPEGVYVSYSNNNQTNVGTYEVIATFEDTTGKYKLPDSIKAMLVINKADITDISFDNQTYTYDGLEHSLTIEGNLPEGVIVNYSNNKKINAGTYEVTATFKDTTGNYNVPNNMKATLVINKADIYGIKLEDQTFTYDGQYHFLTIEGDLPEGVIVTYTNNKKINAGTYEVTASFEDTTGNYNVPKDKKAILEIDKKILSDIKFEDQTFTYDGLEHSILLSNELPVGIYATYTNNKKINVGSYEVIVTLEDTTGNYKIPSSLKATLTIEKANITGIQFENQTFVYDGNPHSIQIEGQLPEGVFVTYTNNDQVNAGSYIVTANFTDTTGNYNAPEVMYATLTIEKANITGIQFKNQTFVYDGNPHSIEIEGQLPEGVFVTYTNNDQVNAGSYIVTVNFTDTTGNYNAPEAMYATLTIEKANITGIQFENQTFVYDGNLHSIEIEGQLPEGVIVTYTNNDQVNAGSYIVTANFTDTTGNYNVPEAIEATLIINKADIDILNIKFEDKIFVYDGNPHSIEIEGQLPEGVIVTYTNNDQVNAGSYMVTANFTDTTGNYNAPETMYAQYSIILSDLVGISFSNSTVTYDGNPHSIEIEGQLPEGVIVTYTNNDQVNAGSYIVTANFTDTTGNYNVQSMTATLTIEKLYLEKPVQGQSTFIYDGSIHKFTYEESSYYHSIEGHIDAINAGQYSLTVGLYDIYNTAWIDGTTDNITFVYTIEKADIDMSNISFEDKTVTYDGLEHSLRVSGELSDLIYPVYTNETQINAGVYEVRVDFELYNSNYNKPESMYATLTIEKLLITKPAQGQSTFTYDGNEHELTHTESIYYYSDGDINPISAGEYYRKVHLCDKNNTAWMDGSTDDITLIYTIKKLYLEKPEQGQSTFIYDGTAHQFTYETGPHYTTFGGQTDAISAGEYSLTVGLYNPNNTAWIDGSTDNITFIYTIEKADIDMSNISFEDKTVTYDGLEHSLHVSGELSDLIYPIYTNDTQIDAGVYEVRVDFELNDSNNYNKPESMIATLTINKADIDMSNISFEDKTVTYNGSEQSIYVNGYLPDGVGVIYTNNCQINIGVYGVIAKFVDESCNYNLPEPMIATLTIEKLYLEKPVQGQSTFTYDGNEHELTHTESEYYSSNGHINPIGAGEYYRKVHLCDKNNTAWMDGSTDDITFYYTIEKLYLEKPVQGQSSFIYDGTTHQFTYEENKWYYTMGGIIGATDAGEHSLTVGLYNPYDTAWVDGSTDNITLIYTIEKADIDMSNISFEDMTVTYDGLEHSLRVSGELSDLIYPIYTNETQIDAGVYEVRVDFGLTDPFNYNNPAPMTATLTIEKADIDMSNVSFEDKTVTYDGQEHSLRVSGELSDLIYPIYTNDTQINAGVYEVRVDFELNDSNNYNKPESMYATLTINKADIDMSNISFEDKRVTYNCFEQSIYVNGYLPDGVGVIYTNNCQINIGVYGVIAKFVDESGNYNLPEPMIATLTIEKLLIEKPVQGQSTFTYDGNYHQFTYEDDTCVYYTSVEGDVEGVDVGEYYRKVYLCDKNNTAWIDGSTDDITLIYTIEKLYLEKPVQGQSTFIYDGTAHQFKYETGPHYTTFGGQIDAISAGEYSLTVGLYNPYNTAWVDGTTDNITFVYTIEKADIDMSNITFEDMTVTYDGQEHSLCVSGELSDLIYPVYTNETQIDAGVYEVRVDFELYNSNYNKPESMYATLTINKADIDMTETYFEDVTVTYDGYEHSITISGSISSALSVTYENNCHINVGVYEATAIFTDTTGNYNNPASMTAILTIEKAQISNVYMNDHETIYTGESHSLGINGTVLPEGVYVTYENNDQVNVGVYEVTAKFTDTTGNYIVPEPITATLTITKVDYPLNLGFHNMTFTYDGLEHSIYVTGDIPEGLEVTYTGNGQTEVGSHKVIVTFKDTTGNYNDPSPMEAYINIVECDIQISLPKTTVTYDGNPHSIYIEGELPEGINVTYENNSQVNAGMHLITAHLEDTTGNYNIPEQLEAWLIIEKADIDTTNLKFEDKTVTYDGQEHSIVVEGKLPEGVIVEYYCNTSKDSCEYSAEAWIHDPNGNYNDVILTAKLTINKAVLLESDIIFANPVVVYNGYNQYLEPGKLPEGISVYLDRNNFTEAGTYEINVIVEDGSGNYIVPEPFITTFTIEKADVDMSNVKFEDKVITYDGLEHSIYIEGSIYPLQTQYSHNSFVDAGQYTVVVTFQGGSGNYNIPDPMTATLTIEKANYEPIFIDTSWVYDGLEHSVSIENLPSGISVYYVNNSQINAGTYEITAYFEGETKNYIVPETATVTMTIEQGYIDLTQIIFNYSIVTYDGLEHNVLVEGNIPDGVDVIYENNGQVNAGRYDVVATFVDTTGNYLPDQKVSSWLLIEKANITNIYFNDQSFEYDGLEHSIYIEGELPEGVSVSYENNGQINAGIYEVTASFTDITGNYNIPSNKTARIIINSVSLIDITFENQEFIYDGQPHSIYISGELPEGVYVTYENNDQVNVGEYIVYAKFTDTTGNYSVPEVFTGVMYINKADYDMSGVLFDSLTVTYNGLEHSLNVENLPEGLTVSYVNNGQTTAGTYPVTANFADTTGNYKNPEPMIAMLTINKADYDMSGVLFDSLTVTYNGLEHSLNVENLPEGLTVSYVNNGRTTAGTYPVTANFTDTTGNYKNPEPMIATLTINKADIDMSNISFEDMTVTYDGYEHSLHVSGELSDLIYAVYTNDTQINAGVYEVRVDFELNDSNNHNKPESMYATLTIEKADLDISGISVENNTFVYDGQSHSIEITGQLPEGVYVTYENNDQVNVGTYEVIITFEDSLGNYNLPEPITATLTIEKLLLEKPIQEESTFIYDGETKFFRHNESEWYYSYGDVTACDAGEYSRIVYLNDKNNTAWVDGSTDDIYLYYTILKADLDISGITIEDKTVVYDGQSHSIEVIGELPEGVYVTYENNDQVNVGTYEVIIVFEDLGNYNLPEPITATLTIIPKQIDVSLDYKEFLYDGLEHSIYITGELPECINVSYSGNTQTEKGIYEVTATFEDTSGCYDDSLVLTNYFAIYLEEDVEVIQNKYFVNCDGIYASIYGSYYVEGCLEIPYMIRKTTNGRLYIVNEIESDAFYEATELVEVIIPESVTTIGMGAFYGCSNIEKITIPFVGGGVSSNNTKFGYIFGKTAYTGGIAVDQASLSSDNTIEYYLPSALKEVTVLGNEIPKIAFIRCSIIETINLGENVTSIGDAAFWGCAKLSSINLENVTSIGEKAFYNCNLDNIDISNVTYISDYAFRGCSNLANIKYSDSIRCIGDYAFSGCSDLPNLVFSNELTYIGEMAFYGCSSFTKVNIPASVTTIGYQAFSGTDVYVFCNVDSKPSGWDNSWLMYGNVCWNQKTSLEIVFEDETVIYDGQPHSIYVSSLPEGVSVTYVNNNQVEIGSYEVVATFEDNTGFYIIPESLTATLTIEKLNIVLIVEDVEVIYGETWNVSYEANINNEVEIKYYNSNGEEVTPIEIGVYTIEVKMFGDETYNDTVATATLTIVPDNVYNGTDYEYSTTKGYATITKYNGTATDVIVPEFISDGENTYMVTGIGNNAFYNKNEITSIELPDTITTIGVSAFDNCSKLITIVLPDTITSIGDYAFYKCESLEIINLSEGLIELGSNVFDSCESLLSITLPSTITEVPYGMCYSCENLETVVLPETITYIGNQAFYNCTNLTNINIPNSVTEMGNEVFSGCYSKLTHITLSNQLTAIPNNTFMGTCLSSIVVPSTVVSVGEAAFHNISNDVVIYYYGTPSEFEQIEVSSNNSYWKNAQVYYYLPNNIKEQVDYWYYDNNGEIVFALADDVPNTDELEYTLSSDGQSYSVTGIGNYSSPYLVIPSTYNELPVTSIGYRAFYNKKDIYSVTIPSSITYIDEDAFIYCSNIFRVYIEDLASWCMLDFEDYEYSENSDNTNYQYANPLRNEADLYLNKEKITDLVIPESVTTISSYAFAGCSSISSVTFNNNVTSIGNSSFAGCTNLANVELSNSITSIGNEAFTVCKSLENIFIPSSVTTMGEYVFYNSTNVVVCCEASSKPTGWSLYWNSSNITYYWSSKKFIVENGLKYLINLNDEAYVVGYATVGEHLIIPDSVNEYPVVYIEDQVFANCTQIRRVTLGENIISIGLTSFDNCTNLIEIYNKSTLELTIGASNYGYIAYYAKNIYTPSTGESWFVEDNGFLYILEDSKKTLILYKGEPTSNIVIPDDVTNIADDVFNDCLWLNSITLGTGLTSLSSNAFSGCYKLVEICNNSSLEITVPDFVLHVYSTNSDATRLSIVDDKFVIYTYNEEKILIDYIGTDSEVVIPNDVTKINDYAFYKNDIIQNVIMGDSILTIGEYAFYECSKLSNIEFSSNIVEIPDYCFTNCKSLESVTLTNEISNVGVRAFSSCESLTSVKFTNGVLAISGYAFYCCYTLSEIELGNKLNSVGTYAFAYIKNLDVLTLTNSVTSVAASAVAYSENMIVACEAEDKPSGWNSSWSNNSSAIIIWNCEQVYTDNNGIVYGLTFDKKAIVAKYIGDETVLVIPSSIEDCVVSEIYANTFKLNTNIVSVEIPNTVTTIGYAAFSNCSNLEEVNIPTSLKTIGDYAFYYCTSLEKVIIPSSATSVGIYAFGYCTKISIYCALSTLPSGFASSWSYNAKYIYYGFTNEEISYQFVTNSEDTISPITSKYAIILPKPTKDGYFFVGWYTDPTLSGSAVNELYYSSTVCTLYASWVTEDEYFDGSSFDRAEEIQLGTTSLSVTSTHRYFKFTATECKSYTITSIDGDDPYCQLRNSNNELLKSDDDSGSGYNFKITYTLEAGQEYVLVLSGEYGSYDISIV